MPRCAALVIGLASGLVRYGAVQLKSPFRIDDALDVAGVHTEAGLLAVTAIGVYASLAANHAGVGSGSNSAANRYLPWPALPIRS